MGKFRNKKLVGRCNYSRKLFILLNIYRLAQSLKSCNSSYSHTHTHHSLSSGELIQGYHDSEEGMRAHMPLCWSWVLVVQNQIKLLASGEVFCRSLL